VDRPNTWFPMYAADFEADTADLDCVEVGAYIRLLNYHFLRGSVPADIKKMSRIIRETPQKTRKLWQVLNHFFIQKGDVFVQQRMEREIAKGIDIYKKRVEAGRKGGLAKAKANDIAKPYTTTTTTTYKNKKPLVRTAARFDEWWDAYGLKKGRKQALKLWKSKKLDGMADELIADAKNRHANDDHWRRGYQPHPTTYLRNERWEDEITKPKPQTNYTGLPKNDDACIDYLAKLGIKPRPGESMRGFRRRGEAHIHRNT